MDPSLIELYQLALSTHKNLSFEDIIYGADILSKIPDINILLRLFKDKYIGKFSPKFNQIIDQLIKSRRLSVETVPSPQIDLITLSSQEFQEFQYTVKLFECVFKNTINYLKLSRMTAASFNEVFSQMLYNLCEEVGINIERFFLILKVPNSKEVGSRLKISHYKLMDIEDVLQDVTMISPEMQQKYQKEIKILTQK